MKATEIPIRTNPTNINIQKEVTNINIQKEVRPEKNQKPHFRPAQDDTKPAFQDPILRSDPIETEEAVLRLPPFSIKRS